MDLNSNIDDLANSKSIKTDGISDGRIARRARTMMKTRKNLYGEICSLDNILLAWKKARKLKTKRQYVVEFERKLLENLLMLREELENQNYRPLPLKTFILRDPKTRKISKSDFRDRIVHHALCNVMEPIFDKTFIYDSCANRKGKGNLFAIRRFDVFKRKVSENGKLVSYNFDDKNQIKGYCLKADIKHYFQQVNHDILVKAIRRKVNDEKVIWLIERILENHSGKKERTGMPLGNMTSQFFANVYLNELDYFIKHALKAKYYLRYVDDMIILHKSSYLLSEWKYKIGEYLKNKLKLELHPEKSRIIPLSEGIDFVGFRNFYHFRLIRKRNVKKMRVKVLLFAFNELNIKEITESYKGWNAYAKWGNSYKIRKISPMKSTK